MQLPFHWGQFWMNFSSNEKRFHYIICEEVELPRILKENADKSPKTIKIKDLYYNWDTLGKSWMDIDILGCLIPDEPGMVVFLKETKSILQNKNFMYYLEPEICC